MEPLKPKNFRGTSPQSPNLSCTLRYLQVRLTAHQHSMQPCTQLYILISGISSQSKESDVCPMPMLLYNVQCTIYNIQYIMLIVVHVLFNMITAVTIHYTGHFTVYSLMLIVILYIFQEAPMSLRCEPCIRHSLNS